MKKKHIGSTLDSLFDELGEGEDVELLTQKKLLAEKIEGRSRESVSSKRNPMRWLRAARTSRTPECGALLSRA